MRTTACRPASRSARPQLLCEHRRQAHGLYRIRDEDRPRNTPPSTEQLLARTVTAGPSIGALHRDHAQDGGGGIRRILGVLALAKQHGVAAVDDACAAALELAPEVSFRPPVNRARVFDLATARFVAQHADALSRTSSSAGRRSWRTRTGTDLPATGEVREETARVSPDGLTVAYDTDQDPLVATSVGSKGPGPTSSGPSTVAHTVRVSRTCLR